MGPADLDLWRSRFFQVLKSAQLDQFMIMLWAVEAVQSGRASAAAKFIAYPEEAETIDPFSPIYAHRWRLETLANEAIIHCRTRPPLVYSRVLDCSRFDTFAIVNNALNGLENSEYSEYSADQNVFDELHRLTQRQFEWQIGFSALSQLYRAAYVYKGTVTRDFFQTTKGFSLNEFTLFCFAIKAALQEFPAVQALISLRQFGLADDVRDKIFRSVSLYPGQARELAIKLRSEREKVAYRPSVLRAFPCIMSETFPRQAFVPLVDLLMLRCTSGLFYDFVDAPGQVKDEVGANFESYCTDLFEAVFSDEYVRNKTVYSYAKNKIETPDIFLVLPSRKTELAIECKGTKMSFDAKFAGDPIKSAERGYREIAKGIFQIWRYVSHKRRGIVSAKVASDETLGLVVTLDSWLTMFRRQKDVIELAEQFVRRVDQGISKQDKIPVVFSTIEDLESVLRHTTVEDFFRALVGASTDKYRGWLLSSIHRDMNSQTRLDRPYPFRDKMGEVLPWWDDIRDLDPQFS